MIRIACTLAAAAFLAGGLPAVAAAAPAVNGIYGVSETPSKLVQGSDGNVWVVVGGNTLARFSPAGVKQEFPLAGVNGAKGITSGPDGNLWLTASSQIVKVPPANPAAFTAFTVNDVITPQAIVTGPDGNLWTASNDKLLKITTASPTTPTLFTLTSSASPGARGITSSGGLLWVVDFAGGAIVSVTTAGVQTPYDVGGSPQEVGAGPGGQVLYANPGFVPQQVGRLVAGGLPQRSDRPLADPFGVTFGQDGAYWVAEFAAGGLARVSTDGVVTTLGGLPKNDPRELTTGPGNTLWVSLELSKQVARITGVDPPPPVVPPMTPPVPAPPAPAPAIPIDVTAPSISKLRISPSRIRRAPGALAPIGRPKPAARLSLTLSEPATVTFSAERLSPGRRAGGRCARPRRGNRGGATCRRAVPAGGSVALSLPAGASTLGFSGRLARALTPGQYRLLAVARDGTGNRSAARRTSFRLLAAAR